MVTVDLKSSLHCGYAQLWDINAMINFPSVDSHIILFMWLMQLVQNNIYLGTTKMSFAIEGQSDGNDNKSQIMIQKGGTQIQQLDKFPKVEMVHAKVRNRLRSHLPYT